MTTMPTMVISMTLSEKSSDGEGDHRASRLFSLANAPWGGLSTTGNRLSVAGVCQENAG